MLNESDITELRTGYKTHLEGELAKVPGYVPTASVLEGQWKGITWPGSAAAEHTPKTGVSEDILRQVGKASVEIPNGFVRQSNFDACEIDSHRRRYRLFIPNCSDT